jgi:hypothetical protein
LIPTRDHRVAARAKNYRYSCNIQVLACYDDRRVIAVAGGGPGNRNDVIHYRDSAIEICRDHSRVLADGGRGIAELRLGSHTTELCVMGVGDTTAGVALASSTSWPG